MLDMPDVVPGNCAPHQILRSRIAEMPLLQKGQCVAPRDTTISICNQGFECDVFFAHLLALLLM
jgi:hypothetical protein